MAASGRGVFLVRAPAPPDTEIFLATLTTSGEPRVGAPVNITNSPGYDNQPSFTPDGSATFERLAGEAARVTLTDRAAVSIDLQRKR